MNSEDVSLKYFYASIVMVGLLAGLTGCNQNQLREDQMQAFIDRHVEKLAPLSTEMKRASYAAEVSGRQEDFARVEALRLELNELYLNREDFAFLEKMKEMGTVRDHRLQRQLDKLYMAYLRCRMDPEMLRESIQLQTRINEAYNNYRPKIDGEPVTMTEIYRIMTTEEDVGLREKAWRTAVKSGPVIVEDFLNLVRMRNELARQAGYADYRAYLLAVREQSPEELDTLFAELERLTAGLFTKLKAELDGVLAEGYGIETADLRPWHYHDPYFQRTPLVYEVDLDGYYADQDVAELSRAYFAGIGMPVDDIMDRSDLYDKPGKNPHAFATDIDRQGDVRILANLDNTERWMETVLHELGHAVYFKYHDAGEPYLLREPAHSFTTEAAAMFFGRLSRNAAWMQAMMGLSAKQRQELEAVTEKYLRFQQVLFARWVLVMYNFEKAVYADPDQDLGTLWWDMVERYQFVNRPEGKPNAEWASKLHFTRAPCYYHNYMLGEMLASQWYYTIVEGVLGADTDEAVSFVDETRVGAYFKEKVFGPAAVYHWNEMIRRSTGEPLTVRYFSRQFVE